MHLSIRTRLILGFGLLVMCFAITAAVVQISTMQIKKDQDLANKLSHYEIDALHQEVVYYQLASDLEERMLIEAKAGHQVKPIKTDLKRYFSKEDEQYLLKNYPQLAGAIEHLNDDHRLLILSAQHMAEKFDEAKKKNLSLEDIRPALIEIYLKETKPALLDAHESLAKVETELETHVQDAQHHMHVLESRLQIAELILLIFAIAISILIAWWIIRSIYRPIKNMRECFHAVAEGDMTKVCTIYSKDELGMLATDFNAVIEKLRQILVNVSRTSNEVAAAAEEISVSAEHLTRGAEEQVNQTSQVAAAIEEMATTIQDVAHKTTQAAENADEAGRVAERGGAIVQASIVGISEISQSVNHTTARVQELGDESAKINDIVTVIDDIADQINLLALNAAIEAARAGEHGRGFAVVADEVRSLAERTSKATGTVTSTIRSIQEKTQDAVGEMHQNSNRMTEGVEQSTEAGRSLEEIVAGASRVSGMVGTIAAASEEQAAVADQVARSIESINNITRESAESVMQAAEAANQLATRSEELRGLMEQFEL